MRCECFFLPFLHIDVVVLAHCFFAALSLREEIYHDCRIKYLYIIFELCELKLFICIMRMVFNVLTKKTLRSDTVHIHLFVSAEFSILKSHEGFLFFETLKKITIQHNSYYFNTNLHGLMMMMTNILYFTFTFS